MGVWGPGVFSDDSTADIRDEYRSLLEDHVPDEEAAGLIVARYEQRLDDDERHLLWLALAAAQHQVGRLQPAVRDKALDVIDSGADLDGWMADAGAAAVARRRRVLAKLREQLTGPQPARKMLRGPWRYSTDLQQGDVLTHTADNGRVTLWRVARIDYDRVGASPVVQQLDWANAAPPDQDLVASLPTLPNLLLRSKPVTCWEVRKYLRKDPDWSEGGFQRYAVTPPRPEDDDVPARGHATWEQLHEDLRDGKPHIPNRRMFG